MARRHEGREKERRHREKASGDAGRRAKASPPRLPRDNRFMQLLKFAGYCQWYVVHSKYLLDDANATD